MTEPAAYDAWYHTPRGQWIGNVEFELMMQLLAPAPDASVLDVGCGTGYFARRFAQAGLHVTGIDPDARMLAFARAQGNSVEYLEGSALALPFADNAFDHCVAITSLCFVEPPERALKEMLRVCRASVVLGLLNRASRLCRDKQNRGGYTGARWDSPDDVRRWLVSQPETSPRTADAQFRSAVFFPNGNVWSRCVETWLSPRLLSGGFLAARIEKRQQV